MILYSSSVAAFQEDVEENRIVDRIRESFMKRLGWLPGLSEQHAWSNSMQHMERVLRKAALPFDCGVLIEFGIPMTSKRIDFIVTGKDKGQKDHFVIVELKQWETADSTGKDGVVVTYTGGRNQEVAHPSYQAWSYMSFLTEMNEAIQQREISGHACAYLHNYPKRSEEPLLRPQYQEIVEDAPLFFKDDRLCFQEYLFEKVCSGRGIDTLHIIENGRLRPSRKLMDSVAELLDGSDAFILLDEQKVAFETILAHADSPARKTVILVQGGPGTGKSVLSVNAFGALLQKRKNVQFIAPNAAFRNVMLETLVQRKARGRLALNALFKGSSGHWNAPDDFFDILIVDEAHRLKRQGAYMYQGQNQVDDMVRTARVTVFFVDDRQQVRPVDIGSSEEIRRIAKQYDAALVELTLSSQFRCAGADGFMNWLTDVLQVESTGNSSGWDRDAFEFRICDTPQQVYERICAWSREGFNARMLAGYAWPWTSEELGNDRGQIPDVRIPEHAFSMPWNPRSSREVWAIQPDGVDFIGCIHTSQGLEFDYVGVLIGNDLKFDPVRQEIWADETEYKDKPGKKGIAGNRAELTRLVKNIYKILCSRGMKGCCIFCRDPNLREYIQMRLSRTFDS